MIYVSFVEIFAKANDSLALVYGPTKGYWWQWLRFWRDFVIALIDHFVPSGENPHEFAM